MLGHDFYEGVFAYDIQFYIDYIINHEKLLSIDDFNSNLRSIFLSDRDQKNRPKEFKVRKKDAKYEGNAGSLRVFSRIVASCLSQQLDCSAVGTLIIKLLDISQLITAPKLTLYEIDHLLKDTVYEYLDLRVQAIDELGMSRIRPKHHYMCHYYELYKFQGPLIHLWAMRMEQKHCFFKGIIRTSKNFKNVTKTCASRHQMALLSHHYLGLFPPKFEIPSDALLCKEMKQYTEDKELLLFLNCVDPSSLIPTSVKVFGTKYEPGAVVVLGHYTYGEMLVGLIKYLAFYKDKFVLGCSPFKMKLNKIGHYVADCGSSRNLVKNLKYEDLADHQPLFRYGTSKTFEIIPHHFVSSFKRNF